MKPEEVLVDLGERAELRLEHSHDLDKGGEIGDVSLTVEGGEARAVPETVVEDRLVGMGHQPPEVGRPQRPDLPLRVRRHPRGVCLRPVEEAGDLAVHQIEAGLQQLFLPAEIEVDVAGGRPGQIPDVPELDAVQSVEPDPLHGGKENLRLSLLQHCSPPMCICA